MESMASKKVLEFIGIQWKAEDPTTYSYKRWILDLYVTSDGWIASLYYKPAGGYVVQIEISGFGKSKNACLRDLKRQLDRIDGLLS